ncbi:MAG: type II toxin-antitoxin system RelE/ParE family toxin [Limisphaerales bacterium]
MAEVILLRGAEEDALHLFTVIADYSEDRAIRFSDALDTAFDSLSRFPRLGPPFKGRYRRKLLIGFYEYGIFYSIEDGRIIVEAILDLRQDPETILRRLGA